MPIGFWNDDEDFALQGLSLEAQVIYLRGIRRFADRNGVAGRARRINRASLSEVCHFVPDACSRLKEARPTWAQVRRRLQELERAGLVKMLGDMVFYLPKSVSAGPVRPKYDGPMMTPTDDTIDDTVNQRQLYENKEIKNNDGTHDRPPILVDDDTTSPVTSNTNNNNNINYARAHGSDNVRALHAGCVVIGDWEFPLRLPDEVEFECGIPNGFAVGLVDEFCLYWRDRGGAASPERWRHRFVDHCKLQWGRQKKYWRAVDD